jgi:hypothetical protein
MRIMKRELLLSAAIMTIGIAAAAQQATAPKATPTAKTTTGDAAKIREATSAGPTDISKGAAVMEMDEKGGMKQLRAGTNGWTCMLVPGGPAVTDSMCMDKAWSSWTDAYMAKKNPQVKTLGIAYMLHGDHGGSNTDPFATGPTATNQWVVSPPHIMVLVPDLKLLDSLPTDPHSGGAWVMYKGTPYAHIMVPLAPVPATK